MSSEVTYRNQRHVHVAGWQRRAISVASVWSIASSRGQAHKGREGRRSARRVHMGRGLYHHVRETWKRPKDALSHDLRRDRMASWRRDPVVLRIDRPTRLDAARRESGYKAKQGVIVCRTRVRRGGLRKGGPHEAKALKAGVSKITMAKSIQRISRRRARQPSLPEPRGPELLLGRSGWASQVLRGHPHRPVPPFDRQRQATRLGGWYLHRGRAARGKTSAGKRGRGLHNKGKGAEKLRPSLKAHQNLGK